MPTLISSQRPRFSEGLLSFPENVLSLEQVGEQVADPFADVAEAAISNIEAASLRARIRQLSPLSRRVICWYYGIDPTGAGAGEMLSLRMIGRRLGVSVGWAHELKRRALDELRMSYDFREAA